MAKRRQTAWLTLIGLTDKGLADCTPHAKEMIAKADYVFGGKRHLELARSLLSESTQEIIPWPHPFKKGIEQLQKLRGQEVVVLASGNPFFYGVGGTLLRVFQKDEISCLPAPSCVSFACAQMGWREEVTTVLSLCGRDVETIRPYLQPQRNILILCADSQTPKKIQNYLRSCGFRDLDFHLLENLDGEKERIRTCSLQGNLPSDISSLVIVALRIPAREAEYALPLSDGLDDGYFVSDGQMTRQEVRALTLCALAPRAGQHLWDVGGGSGTIAIEWLLKDRANRASVIEQRTDRIELIKQNKQQFGVISLDIYHGHAPEVFAQLGDPDAIFIGGGATVENLLEEAYSRLKRGGRLVINGVTLETQALVVQAQRHYGGTLRRFCISRLSALGRFHRLQPDQDILQWLLIKQ